MINGLKCNINVYEAQTSKMKISRARGKGGGIKLLIVIRNEHDGGR